MEKGELQGVMKNPRASVGEATGLSRKKERANID